MINICMMIKVGTLDILVTVEIPEESGGIKAKATSTDRNNPVTIPWLRYYGPRGTQTVGEQDLKK